jgi:hypothetical protein
MSDPSPALRVGPPNTRLQRTRIRAPLSRQPLLFQQPDRFCGEYLASKGYFSDLVFRFKAKGENEMAYSCS